MTDTQTRIVDVEDDPARYTWTDPDQLEVEDRTDDPEQG